MIVVHAAYCLRCVWIWCELIATEVERVSTRKALSPDFDPGPQQMAEVLSLLLRSEVTSDRITSRTVWLPTHRGRALPSTPLTGTAAHAPGKTSLRPWSVSAVALSPSEAVELLCAAMPGGMLAPGVRAGTDLLFWKAGMRFAGVLAASQQFLPGLMQDGAVYRACWKPIIVGSNVARLAELARVMPPPCRAVTADATHPPLSSRVEILTSFIALVVDYLARVAPGTSASPEVADSDSSGAVAHATRKSGATRKQSTAGSFKSLHDQWLHALHAADGIMQAPPAELAAFGTHINDWQRPVTAISDAPWRLCFRLEEPEEVDTANEPDVPVAHIDRGWAVRYLLQASDDPSLFVPVDTAWKPTRQTAKVLKREGFRLREYLLTALGQASRLCSHIQNSLKVANPWGYDMDSVGAHTFLTETALALEMAGFGVILPAWWSRKGTKQRLSVRANAKAQGTMAGGSGVRMDALVSFDWEVALGDEALTLADLEALARLKSPLVKLRGQWTHMSAEDIRAALDFWRTSRTGETTLRQVVQMALGAGDGGVQLPVDGVVATGWIGELLAQLDGSASFEALVEPECFKGSLRPYQQRGFSWLSFLRKWGLGACLADDMGLGKTVQALALILRDWQQNVKQRRPVLLVCPTSVVGNWQKEAARFTPQLPVLVHHGSGRARGAFKKQACSHAIVISSYALLHRDFALFDEVGWAGVILDEAQNIKNSETKQSRAARSLKSDYRIALTGTPVENNVGDLWAIMEFLNPGFLGSRNQFREKFFVPIQAERDAGAEQKLKRLTQPFILRRLKTDKSIINDLPDKLEMKVFCTLTKEQASLYAAVLKDCEEALKGSEGIQRRGVVLAMLSKLKQVCNHPAQFLGDNSVISGRSGKLARLIEMMEEIMGISERALIFTQFAEMGSLLQRQLQETFGREVLFLHGGTSKKKRDEMVERFQRNQTDAPAIFILSLKAGGTGLNLTQANHVFHFDRWWNPAVENQATDRAFRIGQTKNVQVHKFICMGTMEERIDEMIERKTEISRGVVGTGEQWLTELSDTQLKQLFALRKDAVAE